MPCSVPAYSRPARLGSFADGVDEIVVGDAVDDFGPGRAEIVGAKGIRFAIVGLVVLRREIRGSGLVRRTFDEADADEIRETFGRDVSPTLAAVESNVHVAVVGAGPDGVHIMTRGCDGENGRVDFGAVLIFGDGAPGIAQRFGIGTREVRADLFPTLASIDGFPKMLG